MSTIAIDYTPAYEQGGGIGRLVRDLVSSLAKQDSANQYKLFVAGVTSSNESLPVIAPNFAWRKTSISPNWLARIWHRVQIPLPVEVFVGSCDLFHATDFVLPPTISSTKTIVTVHDLSFVRVPDAASPALRAYLNNVVPKSIRKADLIIADSSATKSDIVDIYDVLPDKVRILLSGVDSRYLSYNSFDDKMTIRKKYEIPDRPYLLSVGTIQPRKNYSRSIQALALVREQGYDVDLVIAGGKGWLEDEMYTTLQKTHLKPHVHLIGYAADEDLPALYSAATCTLFPSLYEGFGFPVLESMACGTPVITSNISSLPEVAGNAAILVDPYQVEDIANAIITLLDDSNKQIELIQRGYQQARKFTWEKSAAKLHRIYTDVLSM